MLAFKKRYIEPIQRGAKTMTLRASRPRFAVGDVVPATCRWGDPPFARLVIEAIDLLPDTALTDEHAIADGHESADELRKALDEHYPGARWFWLVRFRLDAG